MDLFHLLTAQLGLPADAFAGQVVIVSGGGAGIGREICRAFAFLGAKVAIAEISESGRETESVIHMEGGQALFVQTDVSDESSVRHMAGTVRAALGPADILVNNAIRIVFGRVLDLPLEQWDQTIAVNLRGNFLASRAFLPDMLARSRGTILNMVSSDAMPGLSAYFASKQGITGLSQSLALEVGQQGVRVIAFAPGMCDTPGLRGAAEGLAPALGMTVEQFMSLSLHPAYPGLMPAEHAAAGTAYLAAKLADEYAGEVVTGFQVLERAGLIRAPGAGMDTKSEAAIQAQPRGLAETLDLAANVAKALDETEATFNKFPIFFRPLAKNGFRGKAGMSLADWQRSVAMLCETLGKIQAGDAGQRAALAKEAAIWKTRLEKLAAYFRGEPDEAAAFTKDEAFLREARRISAERVGAVEALIQAINGF